MFKYPPPLKTACANSFYIHNDFGLGLSSVIDACQHLMKKTEKASLLCE
jgi:hypothetical protein